MMLTQSMNLRGGIPLILADTLAPASILLLCVVAGIGTLYLLPSRRPASARRMGGVALTAALLVLAAMALHATGGVAGPGLGLYFWIFSITAVVGAIRVVTHPRPVYSALYFVLTVFASGGLFVLLAADFLAAALILIYAGAILITYVFVIMLAAQATSDPGRPEEAGALGGLADYDLTSREPFVATCVGFTLLGVMTFLIFDKGDGLAPPQPLVDSAAGRVVPDSFVGGTTQALGEYLFRHQLVNLELAGLILTLAMIGAIIIARRRIVTVGEDQPEYGGEEVLGPATPINDDPHSIPVLGTRDRAQKAYPQT
jgi:NADH-quinone oxidoreductase subunit J